MLRNYLRYLGVLLHRIIAARDWAMRYGTNSVQIVNICFAAIFTYVFGFVNNDALDRDIYSAFIPFTESPWWLILPLIVMMQTTFMVVKSVRCDVLSGFTLLISVPVWTFVSIKFANAGFVNTGMYVYAVWAFVCFIAGWRMMDLYDYRLILKRRGSHAAIASDRAKHSNNTSGDDGDGGGSNRRLHDRSAEGEG